MKKTISVLILCALMVMPSCGEAVVPDETKPTTTSAEVTGEPPESPAVTNADFGGAEITFLMNQCPQWSEMNDFGTGEMNGDVLNDAYYNRNKAVEDSLNIIINVIEDTNDMTSKIQQSVMAGGNAYSAMIARGYTLCSLAISGYLCDLNSIGTLELDHSWWDQGANRDLSFGNAIYMTTGDISTTINEASCVMLFSKFLAKTFDLPDIYSYVRDGKWTLDRFGELCQAVAGDIDGDGDMDENDRYGAIIWDDSMMAAVNSADIKCCSINDNKELELTLYSERTVDAVDKFMSIVGDISVCFPYQRYSGKGDVDQLADVMFTSDRALFFVELLHRSLTYRNMESDYGILPFPKYDEAQEQYCTNVGSYPSVFLAVPNGNDDTEMIGTILENMGYQSKEIVRDAFYNKTLVGKTIRDDESAEMLDIIFANRVYDIGWLEQVGGYNERIMDIFRYGKDNFSSMFAQYKEKALSDIEKINETISASKAE